MENSKISENRIKVGNAAIISALLFLTIGCWNEYSWYEAIAPLGTFITFIALGIALLCYRNLSELLKDKEFYVLVICNVIALINLIVIKSNYGAILTVACLTLMLYLCDKVRMSKKVLYIVSGYIAFYFFYWTIDVKGYFKGYNTNYGGLVLITGFVFALLLLIVLKEYAKKKNWNKIARVIITCVIIYMFAWGYNIIAWYRARCALLGLIVFALMVVIPNKWLSKKWIYFIITGFVTVGSILVSLAYVWLGKMRDVFTIRIFYKDILSGREEIWSELWEEFIKHPITGIGSAYTMKLEWMEGMFEVHNGLLDILIVHGIVVFIICTYLLAKKIIGMRSIIDVSTASLAENEDKKLGYRVVPRQVAFAGIIAILASSFLENFFIVPPFTLCIMILFIWIYNLEA